MSARSGELLGPYRLCELVGQGGMGTVYRAEGPDGHPVAVKVLRPGAPGEETARRRLAREVDTMQRVHSPFVAEVLDADVAGDPPYIVTEYVAGQTLEDVVAADGPLTGQALAALATGLASALAAIHSAGVVHRDLKPGNVMLVGGRPVVIDFGIAQAPDSTRLTMTGMFMGTPGYLAPEVIEGGDSSPAADVHSWAATVAYAATGQPPFGTGQFEAIFYRIVQGQPDLGTLPLALQPIVLSALAKDPARRPSAGQLAGLVAAVPTESFVPAPLGPAQAAAPVAYQPPWQLAGTALDIPPMPSQGSLAAATVAPAGPGGWPGTLPMAVPGRDNVADLLPPVRYQQAAWPASPAGAWQPPAATGGPRAGALGQRAATSRGSSAAARFLLVLATMLGLVALSMLLPLAGAATALAGLVLLRATDLSVGRLSRRRAGQSARPAGAISAVFFYPWALFRTVVRFVLLAPMALLFAGAAAVVTIVAAGPADLPRAVSYAAGALVACYCFGPGSEVCRRPLGKCYDRVARSAPAAVLGCVGLAALAIAVAAAALTRAPAYWPAVHLGTQLQAAANHPVLSNVADVGRRLVDWFKHI